MTVLFDLLPAALGGTAAAGATAAGAAGTAVGTAVGVGGAAAGTGISLSSILSGTASLLSVVAGMAGANADAEALEQQAREADMEQQTEGVKGRANQLAIKREMMDAVGQRDVAAAASGVDLSFGTAAEVRKDAFREADQALTSNTFTTMSNQSQYEQRAATYRKRAKQVKSAGIMNALVGGLTAFA
ncbi:hypothetical protein [Pleomorphomonas koreensis]|uniref:hypothetical protein n=1 Tax=Pleomorphomonas koreensis TaxID=257440 RepID=UPI000406AE27|nr:hypothetical protein [Pleomorphomonas koreensis]